MNNYKAIFLERLSAEGIDYDDLDETTLRICCSGENAASIRILVTFGEDGRGKVAFRCLSLSRVLEAKFPSALVACNVLNEKFRWVKFYVDSDKDIVCAHDAIVNYETVGDVCMEVLQLMVSIIDEAYPHLMKSLWG